LTLKTIASVGHDDFLYRRADFDLRTGQFWAGVFLIVALVNTPPGALLKTLSGTCPLRCRDAAARVSVR
jgi:hypothetical protein